MPRNDDVGTCGLAPSMSTLQRVTQTLNDKSSLATAKCWRRVLTPQ